MALTLRRVIVPFRDREKQLAFWRDVMGLTVKGDGSDPNVVELDTGNGTSLLLMKATGPGGDGEHGVRVVLGHEDVADFYEELKLLGIRVGTLKAFGEHHAFDGVDPEGNGFQVTDRG